MSYAEAGVDREKAAKAIGDLKSFIESKFRPEIVGGLGGFAGAFRIPEGYKRPLIMSTTDGVGTKILLAEDYGAEAFAWIAQDLVGMCVNDLLAARAEPIAFLDYIATGKLQPDLYSVFVRSVAEACERSGCSLIGGETAEMPGFYQADRMDFAGFAVGVLDEDHIWQPEKIAETDLLLGFESNGFHSNGFSLIRKVIKDHRLTLDQKFGSGQLGELLLRPTKLYVRDLLKPLRSPSARAGVHITGGGFYENLERVLPKDSGLAFEIEKSKVPTPDWMQEFVELSKIDQKEAFSTWNMGLGFVAVVSEKDFVQDQWPEAHVFGRIIKNKGSIIEWR